MIIVCSNCATRLQIDDLKIPSKPFSVRCPKCNSTVNSGSVSAAFEQSALTVGESPSTDRRRYEQVRPATAYQLDPNAVPGAETMSTDEAVSLLLDLLKQGNKDDNGHHGRRAWDRRKILLCASAAHRESIARSLAETGCKVFVADDTRQAVETMRANQLQVVILDSQFDAAEQGAAFVVREINVLRSPNRRRLFFILLSPSFRTMDAHAAFLNNVNAVVNIADLEDLPRILEIALREFNDLYKDLNHALSLSPL
jgi:predicted Zn finger-like uncharacterized protein